MPDETYVLDDFLIRDLDTLKLMAHPLRVKIMRAVKKPRTVKEAAAILKTPATKLYYHFNQLEEKGIIQVVETKVVSGIIEKTYQVTARRYRVDENLLSGTPVTDEAIETVLTAVFDAAKDEMRHSFREGFIDFGDKEQIRRGSLTRAHYKLTKAQAQTFLDKLQALTDEIDAISAANEDGDKADTFGISIAFYPVAGEENPGESNEPD